MKKSILLFVSLLLLVTPTSVAAKTTLDQEKIILVGKNEVVEHDYFMARQRVVIDGVINGDAYIAGGQVDINGTVNGDLLVAGGKVTVRGVVTQNIRAIGGTLIVSGTVGRNISAVGGMVTLDKSSKLSGNAALVGGEISILSPVKQLSFAAGDITLESVVSGDMTGAVGNLQLFPDAKVEGNLTYWSDKEAEIASTASVSGGVSFNQTNIENRVNRSQEKVSHMASGFGVFMRLIFFVSALIIGLLLIRFVPIFSTKTRDMVVTRFGKSLALGTGFILVTPFIAILLFVTLIGIPFGAFAVIMYGIFVYCSKFFVAMGIGMYVSRALKFKLNHSWEFVIGLVAFYVLAMIPVIGFFVKIIVLLVGVGALLLTNREYWSDLRIKKIV